MPRAFREFHNEWNRLATFSELVVPQNIYFIRLANNGFFVPGTQEAETKVECAFCGVRVPLMQFRGRRVEEVHRQVSPSCPFVSGTTMDNVSIQDSVCGVEVPLSMDNRSPPPQGSDAAARIDGAVTASESLEAGTGQVAATASARGGVEESSDARRGEGSSSSTANGEQRQTVTYEDLGIFAQRPKGSDMAVTQDRIQTFTNWPHEQTHPAVRMAEAGFYYSGHADLVRCFCCKGGLKMWEPTDQPWVEHCRWFPRCPYVRLVKGQRFVDIVQRLNNSSNSGDSGSQQSTICEAQVTEEVQKMEEEESRNRCQPSSSSADVSVRSTNSNQVQIAPSASPHTGGQPSSSSADVLVRSTNSNNVQIAPSASPHTVQRVPERQPPSTHSDHSSRDRITPSSSSYRDEWCIHCRRKEKEVRQNCGHKNLCYSCFFCPNSWRELLDDHPDGMRCRECGVLVHTFYFRSHRHLAPAFRMQRS